MMQTHHARSDSLLARRNAARQATTSPDLDSGSHDTLVVPLPPPVLSIAVERSPAEVRPVVTFPEPATAAREVVPSSAARPPRSPPPRVRPEPIVIPIPHDDVVAPPPPPRDNAVELRHARTDTQVYQGEGNIPRPPQTPPPVDAIEVPPLAPVPPPLSGTTSTAAPVATMRVADRGRASVTFSPQLVHPRSNLAPFSTNRNGVEEPPSSPVVYRSIATQTAELNDGFITRRGTQPILPILLLLTAPIVLLVSGISYGHYWRLMYATVAPDDTPIALNAYVACLFTGIVVVNCLIYPMCIKILSSGLSTRSQNRHLLGASFVFSGCVCIPLAACELSLLNDSRANASKLGLSAQEPSSTVTLVLLLTAGTFYVWMAYTHYMVNWLQSVMRRTAMKMLRYEGVAVLHQRPGTTTSSVTKLAIAQSSVKRSKRDVGDQFDAIEMDTVSRRVVFSPE